MQNLFEDAEIISTYTRQQAIEDGIFIDVTEVAKNTGFKIPVALTTNLFESHIRKETEEETQVTLKCFLLSLHDIIKISKEKSNMLFTNIELNGEKVKIWAAIEGQSPTDPSPAMNVMLPEDY